MNCTGLRDSRIKLLVTTLILILTQPPTHANGGPPDSHIQVDGFRPGLGHTLDDVMAKYGTATIWHVGDASEAEYRLCYVALHGAGRVIVTFSSSAMAGRAKEINMISVAEAADHADRERCTALRQKLNIKSSIRLGMPKSRVYSLLVNGRDTGSSLIDSTCTRKYMEVADPLFGRWIGRSGCAEDSNRPDYDECKTIRVKFDHTRVVKISHSFVQSVC